MKHSTTVGCLIGAAILSTAGTASAQSWGRSRVPSTGVCFYEDINFRGRYFCGYVGATVEHVPGGADDEISSIRVFGNAEVTVYRDSNFQGSSRRFHSDVADLRTSGWNDRITSYRIGMRGYSSGGNWGGAYGGGSYGGGHRGGGYAGAIWGRPAPPSRGACFYEDINFGGRYFCVRAGEATAQVPGSINDEISSIRMFGSTEVVVFRDANYRGASRRFGSNVSDLRTSGWNDRVSSYRVETRGHGSRGGAYGGGGWPGGSNDGSLELFADINFRGRRQVLRGNTSDVSVVGMRGAISSLRLPDGGTWQVCSEPNYRGRCQVISRNVSDLRIGDWNDVIASARRLR